MAPSASIFCNNIKSCMKFVETSQEERLILHAITYELMHLLNRDVFYLVMPALCIAHEHVPALTGIQDNFCDQKRFLLTWLRRDRNNAEAFVYLCVDFNPFHIQLVNQWINPAIKYLSVLFYIEIL